MPRLQIVVVTLALASCLPPGAPGAPEPATLYEAPWSFRDEHGAAVRFDRFRGGPVVVTAFYTSCPVRCPRTVLELKKLDAALQRAGTRAPVVMVTLDPATDTPERLLRWKREQRLPEHWHLLGGGREETRAVLRMLDMHPAYDAGHIDHEVRVVMLDAEGGVRRRFEGWDLAVAAAP
jgi:protein SCO1/2